MCVHEILAKDGFDKSLYLEMHFKRNCVTESLKGSRSPVTDIDVVIGLVPNVIDDDAECTMSVQDDDHFYIIQGKFAV